MRTETPVALLAPMREVRRVQAFAAEHSADGSGPAGRISFGQNPLFVFGGELAALCLGDHFGVGRRFRFTWRYAAFRLASLGFTPLRAGRSENGRGRENAI
jgi:hypothetical protein